MLSRSLQFCESLKSSRNLLLREKKVRTHTMHHAAPRSTTQHHAALRSTTQHHTQHHATPQHISLCSTSSSAYPFSVIFLTEHTYKPMETPPQKKHKRFDPLHFLSMKMTFNRSLSFQYLFLLDLPHASLLPHTSPLLTVISGHPASSLRASVKIPALLLLSLCSPCLLRSVFTTAMDWSLFMKGMSHAQR